MKDSARKEGRKLVVRVESDEEQRERERETVDVVAGRATRLAWGLHASTRPAPIRYSPPTRITDGPAISRFTYKENTVIIDS
uniref:Uncharacterized protein n=1 Tax=Oryza meridionalis TaxID=40149 RepID=A0A0E0DKG3_9ORYZ